MLILILYYSIIQLFKFKFFFLSFNNLFLITLIYWNTTKNTSSYSKMYDYGDSYCSGNYIKAYIKHKLKKNNIHLGLLND